MSDIFENSSLVPLHICLYTAASIGLCEYINEEIETKVVDVNAKNFGGWTALMYACYMGHVNVVNLLIEAGADVQLKNPLGQTALMLAATCGNEGAAYFVLAANAHIEAVDDKGWTALFYATSSGHQDLVRFLLDNGAKVNTREPQRGQTLLMEAAAAGHEIIVQELLKNNADTSAKSNQGETARSLAIVNGNMKIVSLIDNHTQGSLTLLNTRSSLGALSTDSTNRKEGPSLRDGPHAIAKLIENKGDKQSLLELGEEKTMLKSDKPATVECVLENLDLAKYIPLFITQDIDLTVFLSLNDKDLKEIGVHKFGPRRKIASEIARWHHGYPLTNGSLEQCYANMLEAQVRKLNAELKEANDRVDKLELVLAAHLE